MLKRLSALAAFVLLLGATSAFAQKVNVDFSPKVDFSKYKTYTWVESKHRAPSDITHTRIIEAIDQQMAAKGFTKVGANPDVYIVYNAGAKESESLQGYNYGYGPWRYGGGTVKLDKVVEIQATLVVDFFDAQRQELVFRGIATGTVSDNPDKNAKKIQKAAEKIFKKYPPKVK